MFAAFQFVLKTLWTTAGSLTLMWLQEVFSLKFFSFLFTLHMQKTTMKYLRLAISEIKILDLLKHEPMKWFLLKYFHSRIFEVLFNTMFYILK